jgi:amidohydrolase
VDPIVVSAQIINALQTVCSRQTAPTTPVVVTIGSIHSGTKRNIIPGEAVMQGTVRVLDMTTAAQVKEQIRRIVENTAAAYGAKADAILTDDYPALTNHAALTHRMAAQARSILGDDKVIFYETPSMGADDFAYFSSAAPGCYFNIGTTALGQPPQMLHSAFFAPDEECMATGLALFSAGVWELAQAQA